MEQLKQLKARLEALLGRVPTQRVDIALAVLVTLGGLTVYSFINFGESKKTGFSFINNIELRSLDARFRLRGTRPHDDRIVIVDMDEKTLQRVGAWPIPRSAYAKTVDRLAAGGARVIAFDVAFPTPEKNSAVEALKKLESELGPGAPANVVEKIRAIEGTSDNDVILAESLKKANNVVLGHLFLDADRANSQDQQAADDYYKILSDRPFPQTQKLEGKFDLFHAWEGKKPDEKLSTENGPESFRGNVFIGAEANIRLLAEASRSYGFFNNNPNLDGTMRNAMLVVSYRNQDFFPSLPVEALRVYEDIKPQSTIQYISENGLERMEIGPYSLRVLPDGTALLNFAGPYGTYQHYSMADVLDGKVPPSTFNGKIVFVGATALAIGDLRNTPFPGVYMGVELHANTIDNMLHSGEAGHGFLSHGMNSEMIDIALLLAMGLGLGFVFIHTRPVVATLVAIAGLMVFAGIVYLAFAKFGMWLSFVVPAGTLVADFATITSFRMIFEEREKRKIRKSFSSYVSPGVISLIEKDPKRYFRTGGEMKDLSIMFSDIRSFTTISEGLTPDELVLLLNEYLTEMTDILFRQWGTLDKYIGDAIMAFWGSPYPQEDHAVKSCACALEMSSRLDELNMKWEAQGRKQLSVGIGINSGPVNVGNMGSDKRLAWTVMGDNVNLASRLEGQTKDYNVRIIVGESTYQAGKELYIFRDLDKIRVKGKLKPVNIYELRGFRGDAAQHAPFLAKWDEAMAAYRRGWWSEARNKFEEILRRYPQDGPSQTLLMRCVEKLSEAVPESEWDGVYVARSK